MTCSGLTPESYNLAAAHLQELQVLRVAEALAALASLYSAQVAPRLGVPRPQTRQRRARPPRRLRRRVGSSVTWASTASVLYSDR